jgi:hypothetical protein
MSDKSTIPANSVSKSIHGPVPRRIVSMVIDGLPSSWT